MKLNRHRKKKKKFVYTQHKQVAASALCLCENFPDGCPQELNNQSNQKEKSNRRNK